MKQALAAPASPPLNAISSPVAVKRLADPRSIGLHADNQIAAAPMIGVRPTSIVRWEPLPATSVPMGNDRNAAERREGLRTIRFLFPLLLMAACKSPPDEAQHMPQANAARGLKVIARVGCGACHAVPGLYWPAGKSGPSLEGFAEQGLVAGRLPNRPDVLATFVRDAPAILPGTTMPAMPLSPSEARDIAAYLYATGKR